MTAFDRIRNLLDLFRPPDADDRFLSGSPMRQAAAAVFRGSGARHEMMLITSRDTGRWIVPKGWIEDGEDGPDAALREAWEEAGVTGRIVAGSAVGHYRYVKRRRRRGDALCDVDVYLIRLKHQNDQWPEKGQRRRKWFPVATAIHLVGEAGLKDVIRDAVTTYDSASGVSN